MPVALSVLLAAVGRWIVLMLATWLPRMVSGLLFAFGMNLAVQKFVMPDVIGLINTRMSGLPQVALEVLTALHVQNAITIILSAAALAITGRVALRKIATP